jgi:hypothetical protein
MAIEDNVQARVGGTVTYKNDKGTLFKVESLIPGNKYPERITVWGDTGKVTVGDRVLVSGVITARKGSYTNRDGELIDTVEVSLNRPTILEHEAGAGAPAADTWGAVAQVPADDDTPF